MYRYNIFNFMIHASIPLVCPSFSPAKSPPHLLLDINIDTTLAQGFSLLKENYSLPLWLARGQVKHLEIILIGTDVNISYSLRAILISNCSVSSSEADKWKKNLKRIIIS